MNKNLAILYYRLLIISALIIFSSISGCDVGGEETKTGPARLVVTLVDSPANYAAVNIDIQEISLKTSSAENDGWVELDDFTPGIYNLLEYTGGQELNLGDIEVEPGSISEIRLKLGNNSTLLGGLSDGTKFESTLVVPSGSSSGLKIKVDFNVSAGETYYFKIDFDAAQSVVKLGNTGQFLLKPVLRLIADGMTGAVSGRVLPEDDNVLISVISGNSIIASTYAPEGLSKFFVPGIEAGTYKISFEAGNSQFQKILDDVVIVNGQVKDLGTINLEE